MAHLQGDVMSPEGRVQATAVEVRGRTLWVDGDDSRVVLDRLVHVAHALVGQRPLEKRGVQVEGLPGRGVRGACQGGAGPWSGARRGAGGGAGGADGAGGNGTAWCLEVEVEVEVERKG